MRLTLAAVATAVIAILVAGAAQLHATAAADSCARLSTVTAYAPTGWPEIRGTTNKGQLWVFGGFGASVKPPTAAAFDGLVSQPQPLKWIWRMTGTGPFKIVAIAPDRTRVNPVWGPDHHLGSNWIHPGASGARGGCSGSRAAGRSMRHVEKRTAACVWCFDSRCSPKTSCSSGPIRKCPLRPYDLGP
jgi:hypothetical protein